MSNPFLETFTIQELDYYIVDRIAAGYGIWGCYCRDCLVIIKASSRTVTIKRRDSIQPVYRISYADPKLFQKIAATINQLTDESLVAWQAELDTWC